MAAARLSAKPLAVLASLGVLALAGFAGVAATTNAHDARAFRFPPHPHGPPRSSIVMVAFGDSLAFGTCATPGHGFLSLIARDLMRARPGSTFLNRSHPGATIVSLMERIDEAPARADAVVVVVGANDVQKQTWPPLFVERDRALLARIHDVYPDAAVYVMGVPDIAARTALVAPPLKPLFSELTRYYDGVEQRAASDHGAAYFDFFAVADSPAARDPKNVCSDGIHPSDAGYAALAALVEPSLRRAFDF